VKLIKCEEQNTEHPDSFKRKYIMICGKSYAFSACFIVVLFEDFYE